MWRLWNGAERHHIRCFSSHFSLVDSFLIIYFPLCCYDSLLAVYFLRADRGSFLVSFLILQLLFVLTAHDQHKKF